MKQISLCRASKSDLGAVAQLGERVLCKHDVAGSIPVSSKIRDELSGAATRNPSVNIDNEVVRSF